MSVLRAQQEISSREFAEWLAFSTLEEPGGDRRSAQSVEEMQQRLGMQLRMIGALSGRRKRRR